MELEDIRKEIDAIDDELVRLFVRRLKAADAVVESKRVSGKAVRDPVREREILAKMSAAVGLDFSKDVQKLFEEIFSISRARQQGRLETKAEK